MPERYGDDKVLTPEAFQFLGQLHQTFEGKRQNLLKAREQRQERFDLGIEVPDFNPKTADIRNGDWKVGSIPADLLDRRVEITGPPDRKMFINALNSGARVYMADFEGYCSRQI